MNKKINFWLGMGLVLLFFVKFWQPTLATDPEEERRLAFTSTSVTCQVVEAGTLETVQLTVDLGVWEGQVEEADLELVIGGTEAKHSIYVNGQLIADTPVRPQEYVCGTEADWFSTDSLAIPPELLNQGENTITLTNDGNFNDDWTAANVRIIIHGVLRRPILPEGVPAPLPTSIPGIGAQAIVGTVNISSTYELALGNNISQEVAYQVPDNYDSVTSLPLVIAIHGMGGTAVGTRDYFAAEANSRNWLLAAPYMHGAYYQTPPDSAKSLAWVGAQHDIIDTINYMITTFPKADKSRIYLIGGSMGGQTTTMMVAKYPDIFAAAVAWKPLTDLTDWYNEVDAIGNPYDIQRDIRRETGAASNAGSTGTTPTQAPFEYQRRSPMMVPQNSHLTPITMWHDVEDILVNIHHSRDLKNAINNWSPPTLVTLTEVLTDDNECLSDPYEHCYSPPPADISNFLDDYTLNPNPPLSLTIRTDESKPYYWLNIAQTGTDHWTEIEASYDLTNQTITATISDTSSLSLGFNLGTTPITGSAGIVQAGMGLSSTTYLVNGGGNNDLQDYTSGYLTVTLSTAGQNNLTISAITAQVSANPAVIVANGTATATVTVTGTDQLGNPAPDGTVVQFSTTKGVLPSGGTAIVSDGQGQASMVLTSATTSGLATVEATIGSVTGHTFVDMQEDSSERLYLPIVIK